MFLHFLVNPSDPQPQLAADEIPRRSGPWTAHVRQRSMRRHSIGAHAELDIGTDRPAVHRDTETEADHVEYVNWESMDRRHAV